MTYDNQQTSGTENSQNTFGAKLQNAREAMNLERKDAAAQLRLNESYINMMEQGAFPEDMQPVFIRGYIRAYGKLLQLDESTIEEGLKPIKPRETYVETAPKPQVQVPANKRRFKPIKLNFKPNFKFKRPRINRKYVMRGITIAVAATLLWLVASWWRGHGNTPVIQQSAKDLPVKITETITTPAPVTVNLKAIPVPAKPAADSSATNNQPAAATTDAAKAAETAKPAAKPEEKPVEVKKTVAKKPSKPAYLREDDDYYYED